MAAPPPFTDKEAAFLRALVDEQVEFMVVGLAAAALQGAPAVTQDIDLWLADRSDPRFREALRKVGASYIPPSMKIPPLLVGGGTELFRNRSQGSECGNQNASVQRPIPHACHPAT